MPQNSTERAKFAARAALNGNASPVVGGVGVVVVVVVITGVVDATNVVVNVVVVLVIRPAKGGGVEKCHRNMISHLYLSFRLVDLASELECRLNLRRNF